MYQSKLLYIHKLVDQNVSKVAHYNAHNDRTYMYNVHGVRIYIPVSMVTISFMT